MIRSSWGGRRGFLICFISCESHTLVFLGGGRGQIYNFHTLHFTNLPWRSSWEIRFLQNVITVDSSKTGDVTSVDFIKLRRYTISVNIVKTWHHIIIIFPAKIMNFTIISYCEYICYVFKFFSFLSWNDEYDIILFLTFDISPSAKTTNTTQRSRKVRIQWSWLPLVPSI